MKNSMFVLLALASVASAFTVYRSQDGNLYAIVDTANGPTFEQVTIVELGDPSSPIPPQPNDDRFGLVKASRKALSLVPDHPKKADHQKTLSAYYVGISQAVNAGSIESKDLARAIDEMHKIALQEDVEKWKPWRDATKQAFSDAPINSKNDAVAALRDLSRGLEPEGVNQLDFANLIKFFVEVILPLLLKILGTS